MAGFFCLFYRITADKDDSGKPLLMFAPRVEVFIHCRER
jgi:hypothetical protein